MNARWVPFFTIKLGLVLLLTVFVTHAQMQKSSQNARVDSINPDTKNLTLTICNSECNGTQVILTVPEEQARAVNGLRNSDRVSFTEDEKSNLQSLALTGRYVQRQDRIVAFCGALIACLIMGALLTWWHPLQLVIGEDGRYSNSKLQMAVWFYLVIASYLTMVAMRISVGGWDLLGGVNIPNNLLLLTGMSGLTFAGAKGITTAKVDAALAAGQPNPKPSGRAHFWTDLLRNDLGEFDLGDFQMIVVTVLAVAMYAATVFHALEITQVTTTTGLPDVDTTILATFGLGQGAYLTKKAVGEVAKT